MSFQKRGLGRGLDALMGEDAAQALTADSAPKDAVTEIKIGDIDPNPDQPRSRFDETALRELADSIQSVGVLQPILLCRSGDRYTIIAGERRWRAARLAGLTAIPAIVRDWDDVRRMEAALIENLQRSDLNPVEEAAGVRALMEQCGYTQEEVSRRVGKSRPAVANLLRILTLPEEILDMVRSGLLSAGHARALAGAPAADQLRLARLAIQLSWSVRQLESACAGQKGRPVKVKTSDPQFKKLERMARDAFGLKAQLDGDLTRGRLVIQYKTADDLQHIWDVLESLK